MKLTNRLKFLAGIIVVITICAGLFIYLDYSMSRVSSLKALINSDYYTVGVDYSGVIENQYIDEGAYIKSGDPLFEIRSTTLTNAIKNNEIAKSSLLYSVSPNGNIIVSAAANGRVQTINYRKGAFVPANSEIATVNSENTLYVSATYKLSSPDYARISNKSKLVITLPDNKQVEGNIYDITLDTIDNEVMTIVKARIDQNRINRVAFSVGTPVDSVLFLDTDTWYNRISTIFIELFKPTTH